MLKRLRPVFEVTITIVAFLGVAIDMSGQKGLISALKLLNFFTIQSNLLVFIIMFLVVVNRFSKKSQPGYLIALSGGSALWIIMTGIIFHFMLSGVYQPQGIQRFSNIILHYLTPSLMTIYYFAFMDVKVINTKYPIYWTGYPLIYGVASLIRGLFDGFYPYWFFNPTGSFPDGNGSYLNVILIILVLALSFLIVGYIITFIKKLLFRKS